MGPTPQTSTESPRQLSTPSPSLSRQPRAHPPLTLEAWQTNLKAESKTEIYDIETPRSDSQG